MSYCWITIEKAIFKYHVDVDQIRDLEERGEIERGPDVETSYGRIYQYSESQIASLFSRRDKMPTNKELLKAAVAGALTATAITELSEILKSMALYRTSSQDFDADQKNNESFAQTAEDRQQAIYEKISVCLQIVDDWQMNFDERNSILGFDGSEGLDSEFILFSVYSHDVDMRCKLIFSIKRSLTNVFGNDNLESQIGWLRAPTPILEGQSPLRYIEYGGLISLFTIARILEEAI